MDKNLQFLTPINFNIYQYDDILISKKINCYFNFINSKHIQKCLEKNVKVEVNYDILQFN